MSSPSHALFVTSAPGLEAWVAEEIAGLGVASATAVAGGVELTGDDFTLYRLNLELGLALNVLVRVGRFSARHFSEFSKACGQIAWETFIGAQTPVRVRAKPTKCKLYHTKGIEERVLAAIEKRLGFSVTAPSDADALEVQVRGVKDDWTMSIDSSGLPLVKRGYRLATAKAPLRADLARAAVIASGWDRESPLVDPFCGSGTVLIEAVDLALGRPPGHRRDFAFMRWPTFDADRWARVRETAMKSERQSMALVRGSDRDPGAVEAALGNVTRAGLEGQIEIVEAPMGRAPFIVEPLGPRGTWVSNPPHGGRVGQAKKLKNLYQSLGTRAGRLGSDWRVALVVSDKRQAYATGLSLESRLMTDHGGRKVWIMTGRCA